jgi:hypothetical protein
MHIIPALRIYLLSTKLYGWIGIELEYYRYMAARLDVKLK